jgi:hypothetical protein
MATSMEREKLFASIREHLPSNTPPGMLKWQREDLSKTNEHLFLDVPAEGSPQLKYLANSRKSGNKSVGRIRHAGGLK